MSKEYFEALERLAMPDELHIKECKKAGIGLTEDYEVVEKALQRLESIDNANPSEALECLENIWCDISTNYTNEYVTIKQALIQAEQDKKKAICWDIVKKKQVDLGWLWYCIHECVNSLNDYNKRMPIEKFRLTEEEFELLRSVLEC